MQASSTNEFERKSELLFSRFAIFLTFAVCALIPIRLSLTYCALVPLIGLWLASGRWRDLGKHVEQPANRSFAFFLLIIFITAWFGVDVRRSLSNLLGLTLAALTPIIVAQVLCSKRQLARALILLFTAQTLAASHSVIDALLGSVELPRLFVGTLTESGQLALVLPLLLAYVLADREFVQFSNPARVRSLLSGIALPLLILALIFNLKRGPWIGCIFGCAIVLLRLRPRLTGVFLACAVLTAISITPVRHRLAEAPQNFFIAGGRSAIWEIGAEMIVRYPLGIGFQNSPILRQFDHSIPENLKHFHSNFINLAVETGMIGLAAFLMWIIALLKIAWRCASESALALGIFAAVLSSQIAGLLEYNFGDSEIKLIYFILAGILLALTTQLRAPAVAISDCAAELKSSTSPKNLLQPKLKTAAVV